jgi:hypothetical protein
VLTVQIDKAKVAKGKKDTSTWEVRFNLQTFVEGRPWTSFYGCRCQYGYLNPPMVFRGGQFVTVCRMGYLCYRLAYEAMLLHPIYQQAVSEGKIDPLLLPEDHPNYQKELEDYGVDLRPAPPAPKKKFTPDNANYCLTHNKALGGYVERMEHINSGCELSEEVPAA